MGMLDFNYSKCFGGTSGYFDGIEIIYHFDTQGLLWDFHYAIGHWNVGLSSRYRFALYSCQELQVHIGHLESIHKM